MVSVVKVHNQYR